MDLDIYLYLNLVRLIMERETPRCEACGQQHFPNEFCFGPERDRAGNLLWIGRNRANA